MSVSDYFSTFCTNLRMSDETVEKISLRFKQITKRINLDYRNISSETAYSLYVDYSVTFEPLVSLELCQLFRGSCATQFG